MLYRAMIDDFELELMDSADIGFEKSIAEYEVPFANGALLDDMGVKARKFTIKTMWRRDNYERYGEFLEHAAKDILNTYVDPGLGIIHGRIRSVNVVRDARQCAELDIEFIEDANPAAVPAYAPPLVALMEEGFGKAATSLLESVGAAAATAGVDTSFELEPDGLLSSAPTKKPITGAAFLAAGDRAIKALNGVPPGVLNSPTSAVGMFNYGLTVPGRIVGAIAGAAERSALLAIGTVNAPAAGLALLRKNTARLAASLPDFARQIAIAAAAVGAIFGGKALADDDTNRKNLARVENAPQWRPDGTRHPAPLTTTPILTVNDIENTHAQIAALLYDGVAAARADGNADAAAALSAQAAALKKFITDIIVIRERIMEVEAETVLPLHLLCLRHGLPYSYADRIAAINNFWNPTFCSGKVKIYERR